mgnify:FL=1
MAAPHCRSHQDKVKSPQKGIYAASNSPHGHEVTDYIPSPDIGSQRPISGLYRYGQRIIGVGNIRKERSYTALAMQANSVCEQEEDVL